MEDKLPAIKSAVVGINRSMPLGKRALAAEAICIFYEDGSAEIVDVSNYDINDSNELEEKKQAVSNINLLIKDAIKDQKKYKTLYSDSKDFKKIFAKAEKLQNKESNSVKQALAVAGIVLSSAALGVGISHLHDRLSADDVNVNTSIENNDINEDVTFNIPSVSEIENNDLSFYAENAMDTKQKKLILGINDWLSQVNGKEDWTKVTLTQEQMTQYNITNPNCLFGFTAEDMYSLALRFGHYSNDDYVTLTGGAGIDVVSIMDDAHSQSNGALASIISYYLCSEECDLNIENIVNFNEAEVNKINEIESLLREYKVLEKAEKEDEAKAKMSEIKSWFINYANSVDFEQDNAKSYILRTMLPACSIISTMHQYEDTISLTLYDTKKDENVEKEIKTDMFDEIMMRNLVLGYVESDAMGAFNSETFLEDNGIDQKRYNLLNTDVERSIADLSCSSQSERLEQADRYIATLRSENLQAEAAYAAHQDIVVDPSKDNVGEQVAAQMDQMNFVQTPYDKLTKGTYESSILIEKVNDYLKTNNIYPENMNWFNTGYLAEQQIAYKDTHGVTAGKKGDTIPTDTQKDVPIGSVKVDDGVTEHIILDEKGNKTTEEKIKEEAREEYVEENDVKDGSTEEKSDEADEEAKEDALVRQQMLQGVYNATFNYYNGGSIFDTSNTYGQSFTEDWASSSDADIVNSYNMGKADGLKCKQDRENAGEFGGEVIIYPEEPVIPDEPVDPVDPNEPEEPGEDDDEYTDEEPKFNPVVDDTKQATNVLSTDDINSIIEPTNPTEVKVSDNSTVQITVNPEFEGVFTDEELQEFLKTSDGTNLLDSAVNGEKVEEGYTDQPPVGFSPVASADLENFLNTKEGIDFLASMTASESVSVENNKVRATA